MPKITLPVSGEKWKELTRTEWTKVSEALQDVGELRVHYARPDGTKSRLYTLNGISSDLPTDSEPYAATQFFALVANTIRQRLPRAVVYRETFEYRAADLPDMAYSVQFAPGPRHEDVASILLWLANGWHEFDTVEAASEYLDDHMAQNSSVETMIIQIRYGGGTIQPEIEMIEVVLRPGKPFSLPLFLYAVLALW